MESLLLAGVGAVVSALGGWLVWLAMRRPLDRIDAAEGEIKDLRDQKFVRLQKDLDGHVCWTQDMFVKNAEARKAIYEELTWVKTHFVHVKNCADSHAMLRDHLNQVTAMTSRMEALSQRTTDTMQRGERLLEQVIAIRADLAGVIAQVEDLHRGH